MRPFHKFLLTFIASYVLLISVVIAGPKWKDEVGIASWCYNLAVLKAIIKADLDRNPEAAQALLRKAIRTKECFNLPVPMAAFKPAEVVETFSLPDESKFSIVKGNVIKKDNSIGKEAYVLIEDTTLPQWQMGKATKTPAKLFGKGWQYV